MQETRVQSLSQEGSPGEGNGNPVLAWEVPQTEVPRQYSPWGCKELHTTETTLHSTWFFKDKADCNTFFDDVAADAAAKSLQSYLSLYNPIDGSPPGSPVPGILQARVLEWVPVSFSSAWKWSHSVLSNS